MELAGRVEEKHRVTGMRKQVLSTIKTGTFSSYSIGGLGGSYSPSVLPTSPSTVTKSWVSTSESQGSVYSPKSAASGGGTPKPGGEFKRLTEKELQDKKAKGLCFRCDDKWMIGHRCRKKELSVLLMSDDEGEEVDGVNSNPILCPAEEFVPEVSLNSVIGLSNPKIMKLRGLIGEELVVVMVDPGATHNFLSLPLVEKLKIPMTQSGSFGVSLGNGEAINGSGICKGVAVHLDGGVEVLDDFLPLTLGNSDVILGVQWLKKLGPVVTNWKTQEMSFELGGNTVKIVGDPALVRAKV
ncbi:hypothetical protein AgCh_011216 [Apium graveolens]